MTDTLALRTAIIGLLGCTAVEEELLLAAIPRAGAAQGSPDRWAAAPLIAHNTEFKRQQVQRLDAIRGGETPPAFAEIDHRSGEVYRRYSQQSASVVAQGSRDTTAALIDGLSATSDDDLLDPSRNPWLAGRQLWLQVIVRGFWHPMGHIGEYYAGHAEPGRASAMQSHAVAVAEYLKAPDPARGMAYYNLACARAQAEVAGTQAVVAGTQAEAAGTQAVVAGKQAVVACDALGPLRRAIELNPDLAANAGRDADLAVLRDSGQLDTLLAS